MECFRCGRFGHWANNCFAKTTVGGGLIEDESDEDVCQRCGREGHDASCCYARTTVNGSPLWTIRNTNKGKGYKGKRLRSRSPRTLPSAPTPRTLFDKDINPERINYIMQAKKCIFIAAYSFNHRDLIGALNDADDRGVRVRIIMNRSQYSGTQYGRLHFTFHENLHEKFMLVDDTVVFSGSANFSHNSDKHMKEDCTLIFEPATIKRFRARAESLWREASQSH